MRHRIAQTTLLLGLAAFTACDPATAPEIDGDGTAGTMEPVDFEPASYNGQLVLGEQTALTASASDMWPQLEGDVVAWYRAEPAAEQGLWVMDLATGQSERIWQGTVFSTFDLSGRQIFWGGPDGLYRYDIASGTRVTLDDAYANYAGVAVSPTHVTGTASDNGARPFHLDRATRTLTVIQTPTAVTGARGWGDFLVWSDYRDGLSVAELRMLDISSGTESVISDTGQLLNAGNSGFDAGRVIYFPRRFCPGSLAAYTLADGTTAPVELTGVSCPRVVDLEDDILVWSERRGGGVIGVGFLDLATGDMESMELADPGTRRIDADLDGLRVVHTSARGLVLLELSDPPEPPLASAGGPYEVPEGSALVLDGSASLPGEGGELAFSWDMGDGTVVDGTANPEHAWVDDGSYTVTLTVTETVAGEAPLSSSAEATVTVTNQAPVVVLPGTLTLEAGAAGPVEASFTDAGVADGPWNWSLTLDGREVASGDADDQGDLPVGNLAAPEQAGEYVLALAVTDNDGASGTAEAVLAVTAPARRLPEAMRIRVGNGDRNSVPAAGSSGVFPVVVHGMELLPVGDLSLEGFRFGPAGASPLDGDGHAPETTDVDGDGMADLVLRLRMDATGLTGGETSVCLLAETHEGDPMEGCGPIRVAGGGNPGGNGNR